MGNRATPQVGEFPVARMFHPRRTDADEVLSVDQSPPSTTFREQRDADAATYKMVGHNEQMQHLSRIATDTTTVYGDKVGKGTAFFLRQDFNTVENPFGVWADGEISMEPRAAVHFVGMGPSAQHYEQMRSEMDSQDLVQRHDLTDDAIGFTKILHTTHRQNFLLPPRAHRCCPLAELL